MALPYIYSNEEKSLASKRMKSDPQVQYYNDQINVINSLWAYPKKIMHGETVLVDKVYEMPEIVMDQIKYFEQEREEYIKENYPELSGD